MCINCFWLTVFHVTLQLPWRHFRDLTSLSLFCPAMAMHCFQPFACLLLHPSDTSAMITCVDTVDQLSRLAGKAVLYDSLSAFLSVLSVLLYRSPPTWQIGKRLIWQLMVFWSLSPSHSRTLPRLGLEVPGSVRVRGRGRVFGGRVAFTLPCARL